MLQSGYSNICIESDSLEAVDLIMKGPSGAHPLITIIKGVVTACPLQAVAIAQPDISQRLGTPMVTPMGVVMLVAPSHPFCSSKSSSHSHKLSLNHIYRQANQSADHLARIGAEQLEDLVTADDSPQSVRNFLLEDGLGVGRPRS